MVQAKFTLIQRIKSYIAFYAFKVYLWANGKTEQEVMEMFREIVLDEMRHDKMQGRVNRYA